MTEPVDAIRAIHNAFRKDMWQIDTAAFGSAKGMDGFDATIERFRFFNEILVWHAKGEELAIFPALENVAPLVAEAYVKDHRGLDLAFDELNNSYSARDVLKTARDTAAFRFIWIFTWTRKIHTSTVFSGNESPWVIKGRRLVSWPARFHRNGSRM